MTFIKGAYLFSAESEVNIKIILLTLHVIFSLNELVQHGKNGYVFKTASELSAQIQNWFEKFPDNETQKEIQKQFISEIELFQRYRWRDNWKNIAAPVFNDS